MKMADSAYLGSKVGLLGKEGVRERERERERGRE